MVTRQQFDTLLKDEFAPELRKQGFQGSGRNFYRSHKDHLFLEILNIQSSQWNGPGLLRYTYYVNHGIQVNLDWPDPCPKQGHAAAQFRKRLSAGHDDAWKTTSPAHASQQLRHVLQKLDTDGRVFVHQLTNLDGPLGELTTKRLATILSPGERSEWSKLVQTIGLFQPMALLLVLARLYHLAGDTKRSKDFAEWALKRFRPFSDAYAKPYQTRFHALATGTLA